VIPKFDPAEAFNARTSDPDTSHQGVTRIRPSDKASVLGLFQTAGIRGLTDREVQAACPESTLPRLESWRKRRSDLSRSGELMQTEERRGGQIVWRCSAADRLF
jgi:hypothetical protein